MKSTYQTMGKHFGNAIRQVLKQEHITQKELATQIPIDVEWFRHICAGDNTSAKTRDRIYELLPQRTHPTLTQGWLMDHIPQGHENDILISEVSTEDLDYLISDNPGASNARQRIRRHLDDRTKRAIVGLALDAIKNRHTRKALQATYDRLSKSA